MLNKQITLRIDKKTHEQIEKIAGKNMRKFSDMVRVIIKENLERYGQVKPQSIEANTRSQLLFTTHDVLLMDQKLFRRDEMWIVERTIQGESSLVPFSEYKDVRYDKDIRKSYLQGRLGGIPRILISGAFIDACTSSEEGH